MGTSQGEMTPEHPQWALRIGVTRVLKAQGSSSCEDQHRAHFSSLSWPSGGHRTQLVMSSHDAYISWTSGTEQKKKKKEVGLQEVRSGWRESRICTLIQLKALGQTGKQACPVISLSLRSHTCTAEGQASTEVRGRRWAWVGTGVGTCTARSKDHKSCISVSCAYGISKGLLPTTCGAPTLLSSKSKF